MASGGRSAAVAAALAGAGAVVVVGDGVGIELRERWPDRFNAVGTAVEGGASVVATAASPELVTQALAEAERLSCPDLYVLVEGDVDAARARLDAGGLAVAETRRVVWEAGSAEPALTLVRLVRTNVARGVDAMRAALVELETQLRVYQEREIEHAATREAERVRARRLAELEPQLERLGGAELAAEVEALRAEVAAIKATRVWRLGQAWWRLRDRLSGRAPAS